MWPLRHCHPPNIFSQTASIPLLKSFLVLCLYCISALSNSVSGVENSTSLPYAVWRITDTPIKHASDHLQRPRPLSNDYRLDSGWRREPYAVVKRPVLPADVDQRPRWQQRAVSTTTQFPTTSTDKPLTLEDIDMVEPFQQDLRFYANQTLAHWRTDSWMVSHSQCLEMRYWLEGKRTRWVGGGAEEGRFQAIFSKVRRALILVFTV